MGIWVCFWRFFQFTDHVGSIFIVLSWVENDLFFLFLLLFTFLFGFLLSFFISLLSGKLFLLFESFLLVFAQLLFALNTNLTFLTFNWLIFDFLLILLLNWLLSLGRILLHV